MRILMTLLTLGAGFVGYAYLQQTTAIGEPFFQGSTERPSFDWSRGLISSHDATRTSVKELVNRVHEHTKSILDEFVNKHGGYSDAPTDNAFDRLRQVTQSSSASSENRTGVSRADGLGWTENSSNKRSADSSRARTKAGPPTILDDLQRVAFEPADIVPSESEKTKPAVVAAQTSDRPTVPAQSSREESRPAIQVITGTLESTSAKGRRDLIPTNDVAPAEAAPSTVSRDDSNPPPKRSTTTTIAKSSSDTTRKNVGEWKIVGKTTEGRPMHSMHLGSRGTRTLVIAGLDGEDRFAVRWLEQLADALSNRPDLLDTNEVVFFRAGNPDGLVHKAKENARGVALNRNFPSRRYRPNPNSPSAAVPASEMETRVILDTLYTFRPRRVIHLTATTGRSQVFYNRLGKETATEFERSTKSRLFPLDVEQCPGSLEDFADGTLEGAVISMKLSIGGDWQKAWTELQPRVLASVVGRSIELDDDSDIDSQDPDRTPIPNATIEPVSQNPRRRGYEELPPPPE